MNTEVNNVLQTVQIANNGIFKDALSASEISSRLARIGGGSEQEGIREIGRMCYKKGAEDAGKLFMDQLATSYCKTQIENQYLNNQNNGLYIALGVATGVIALGAAVGGVVLYNQNKRLDEQDVKKNKAEKKNSSGCCEKKGVNYKPWDAYKEV